MLLLTNRGDGKVDLHWCNRLGGDHDSLYPGPISSRDKLKEYAGHFPIVEVDTAFYAIQPKRNAEKWVNETRLIPVIVKAYQGMTGHQRGEIPFENKQAMFKHLRNR